MSSGIRVYKIEDFIRFHASGEIDLERSMQLIREIAGTASPRPAHAVLVDLRKATLAGETSIGTVLKLSLEIARYGSSFPGWIANVVVPSDPERLFMARQFEMTMQLRGFNFRAFTSFQAAVDYLSA